MLGSGSTSPRAEPDFDEEARRLFKWLSLPESGSTEASVYNDADIVWRHPETDAQFFIGSVSLAHSRAKLERLDLHCIVNCQELTSENYHEDDPNFKYLRFNIAHWQRAHGVGTNEGLLAYMQEYFDWVDGRLSNGENVLVHCHAGAHRAGTAGTAFVMYKTGMDCFTALRAVQARRPFVEPIGHFADLLERLSVALEGVAGLNQAIAGNDESDFM